MAKAIAYANQKGGVGKSTICIQQAFDLAEKRKKSWYWISMVRVIHLHVWLLVWSWKMAATSQYIAVLK